MGVKDKVRKEVEDVVTEDAVLSPERIAQAYREHWTSPNGAIVLADLRAKFNSGSTVRLRSTGIDPLEVIYREGQRALYLALVERMEPPVTVTYNEEEI